jgi:release factor glutamine methyltransferase
MLAQVSLEPINSNLALPFHFRLRHSIDVIIFNPPYVPTLTEEAREAQNNRDIQGSWAGGSDGMNITDQFLDLVEVCHVIEMLEVILIAHQPLMAPRAKFYLVAVKENNIPSIRHRMLEVHGLQSEVSSVIIPRLS